MKLKYYITRFGYLVEVCQNPCCCHPFDLLITYSNRLTYGEGQSVSICFNNQKSINKYCRVWELLK